MDCQVPWVACLPGDIFFNEPSLYMNNGYSNSEKTIFVAESTVTMGDYCNFIKRHQNININLAAAEIFDLCCFPKTPNKA